MRASNSRAVKGLDERSRRPRQARPSTLLSSPARADSSDNRNGAALRGFSRSAFDQLKTAHLRHRDVT